MAGGVIKPWESTLNQVVGNAQGPASFKGAGAFYQPGNADGLESLARGLGGLGNTLFKIGIQDRQERQQIALLEDIQGFRRASNAFMTNYMADNQGANAGEAMEAYQQWSTESFNPLREKWAGIGKEQEGYFMQHAGSIVTGGLNSMLDYQRGQTERWYDSAFQGEMAMLGAMASDPSVSDETLRAAWAGQKALSLAHAQRKGLSPEAALTEIDGQFAKMEATKFATSFEAMLKTDPDAAEAMLKAKTYPPDSGGLSIPKAAEPYMGFIRAASSRYGVPENIILAVAQTESSFRPGSVSPTGVRGLMQVTQDTYKRLGFKGDRSDPENSIMAGTKLLGELYSEFGDWNDALVAYNGSPRAVRGMKTGDWGDIGPEKQSEIKSYVPTVMNNMRGLGQNASLKSMFSPDQIEKMRLAVVQARDDKVVNDLTASLVAAYESGSDVDISAAYSAGYEAISAIGDPVRRNAMARDFEVNSRFQADVRAAADQEGKAKFIALSDQEKWSPAQRLERLGEVQGISPATKQQMEKDIREGKFNLETRENMAAVADIRAAIDRGYDGNGDAVDETAIMARLLQAGATKKQSDKTMNYFESGGKEGALKQTMVNQAYARLNPKSPKAPPDAYDFVLGQLPDGGPVNISVVRDILANGMVGGEIAKNWWLDDDATYMEAVASGRENTWLPDVSNDEENDIRLKLSQLGIDAPSDESIREYKYYSPEYMGRPRPGI